MHYTHSTVLQLRLIAIERFTLTLLCFAFPTVLIHKGHV
jgi:hypothetical protein